MYASDFDKAFNSEGIFPILKALTLNPLLDSSCILKCESIYRTFNKS